MPRGFEEATRSLASKPGGPSLACHFSCYSCRGGACFNRRDSISGDGPEGFAELSVKHRDRLKTTGQAAGVKSIYSKQLCACAWTDTGSSWCWRWCFHNAASARGSRLLHPASMHRQNRACQSLSHGRGLLAKFLVAARLIHFLEDPCESHV